MMKNPPRSVLIVRLSAIGDVIHSLPVLEAIRNQLPEAKLGWVVEELSAPLLKGHPDLQHVYTIPKKHWRKNTSLAIRKEIKPFFQAVRQDGWDAVLDLQGLMKSALASWGSGAKTRVGFSGANAREASFLLYNRQVKPHSTDVHVVQQNLRLLEGIGLTVPEGFPKGRLGISDDEQEDMAKKLRAAGLGDEKFLLVNPGAGWITKRYPPRLYGELAAEISRRHGLRPVVLWGPKEEAWRDQILESAKSCDPIAAPPTSIREMAVLISKASLFVGADTGASHMAGLQGVPSLTIFGASDSQRNCPWPPPESDNSFTVHHQGLSCLPCWKTKCPLAGDSHLACMLEFSPEAIMEQAGDWLKRKFSS